MRAACMLDLALRFQQLVAAVDKGGERPLAIWLKVLMREASSLKATAGDGRMVEVSKIAAAGACHVIQGVLNSPPLTF